MSDQAANLAAQPNSSLNAPSVPIPSSRRDSDRHCSKPSSVGVLARPEMGRSSDELYRREREG